MSFSEGFAPWWATFTSRFFMAPGTISSAGQIPKIFKPALGGAFLGIIAFFLPQILDGGYGWVQAAMEGKIFWGLMLLLALMKILATSATISSGGSGGVFGPSVFIGAMLGGAFGSLGHQLAPGWVVYPSSFVVVGIGGFFAGVAKVPISSIIMSCEMCGSYTLLVPLMVVATTSFLLLQRPAFMKNSWSTAWLPRPIWGSSPGGSWKICHVHEAMVARPVTLIPENMPFDSSSSW